jgi:hypothetical protein
MVANFIADVFDAAGDAAKVARVGEAVKALCAKFPVYGPKMHESYGMTKTGTVPVSSMWPEAETPGRSP